MDNTRRQALEQEVKEKTLLIGKLRHEGGHSSSLSGICTKIIYASFPISGNYQRASNGSTAASAAWVRKYEC